MHTKTLWNIKIKISRNTTTNMQLYVFRWPLQNIHIIETHIIETNEIENININKFYAYEMRTKTFWQLKNKIPIN